MKTEWKILKANADTERAQLNRILADIQANIKDTAQTTLQQANIQATLVGQDGFAMSSAWRETYALVQQLDGGMRALSQDVTSLESAVYDPVTGLIQTASALQALTTEVNTLEGTVMAAYTLTLDVNGYVTGWKFTNDGTTGLVDFRADRFRITAPGSIKSVEFADGVLMSVTPSHAYYLGVDIGTANNLITWYGPTPAAGEAGATTANGLFWINNAGQGYFGGGLSNSVVADLPVVSSTATIALSTQTRINNTGAGRTIEQVASAVLATEAAVAGKADSGAFLALQAKVNHNTTGLDTKASGDALLQVDARLKRAESPQSNLYPNPSGAAGLGSWGVRAPDTLSQLTAADAGAGYRFRFVTSDAAFRLTGPYIRVVGGFDYALSADFNISSGTDVQFSLYFYDSTGAYINRGGLITVRQGSGWERESSVGTAPANAVEARVNISGPAGQAGKNIHFRQIKLEQASASTPFTDDATTAALADAALSLRSDVTQQGGLISANANAILQANADIGGVGASVTQVMNAQASSSGNGLVLKNPGFEFDYGWGYLDDADANSSNGLVTESSYVATSPHSGSRVMRFGTGAGGLTANRFNTTPNMAIDSSKRHRIVGWTRITQQPPAGRAYFQLRWYGADGTTVVGSDDTFKNWTGSEGWSRTVGQWVTPPAGAAFVRVLIGSNSKVAPLYLYYDDISVEVESTTDEAYNASYSIVLDVNGRVSGVKFNNTGTESSVDFLSDRFSVTSATGAGLQWTNGTLWNRRGSYSMLAGPDLGEGMLFYIGATPSSPAAAAKANAIFYVDNTGTGYFAGRVLQGIIRTFESSTTVGNVTVTGPATSSNGKAVSLEAKFKRTYQQVYQGTSSVITLSGGQTEATVQIQRRYGTGAWTNLGAAQKALGTVDYFSEPGSASFINYIINDTIMATDIADPRERQYRVVVTNITFQTHNVTNPGTTPPAVNNQYASIESME